MKENVFGKYYIDIEDHFAEAEETSIEATSKFLVTILSPSNSALMNAWASDT